MFFLRYPKTVLVSILLLCAAGAYLAVERLTFSFNLEDFFPSEDDDLTYFREFKERFEPDDNFMMVALHREAGVFDSVFLQQASAFSKDFRRLEFPIERPLAGDSIDYSVYYKKANEQGDSVLMMRPITSVQSILSFEYPIKTPLLGFTSIPAVHLDQPALYEQDRQQILADERLRALLISEDAKTLVFFAKTHTKTSQYVAKNLVYGLEAILKQHNLEEYHLLGPAYFQTRLTELQIREFLFSTVVSFFLLLIVMSLIFRRFWGVMIALWSISVGLLLFIGFLGALGRELDTMAMLYPIIMIIVGTSDVIHVMTKYVDELQKGRERMDAIRTTIREIGMSVFLTSATTAIGFFSLYTSRVEPIQNFGLNAGAGVMIAYASVMIFTTTLLTLFNKDQISRYATEEQSNWTGFMDWLYRFTKEKKGIVLGATVVSMGICAWGISLTTTNNRLEDMLPRGEKVTEDFLFFERQLSGFRPLDIAITLKDTNEVEDYAVVRDMARLEDYLRQQPEIQTTMSITTVYKSIYRALNGNQVAYYRFPDNEADFEECRRLAKRFMKNMGTPLVSKDGRYARISARFLDIGAERSRELSAKIRAWIDQNLDPKLASYRQTGTGILVDKNAEYMRDSLIQGLGFAFLMVALAMGFLYRSFKMVFIALLPNIPPIAIAGAILGFTGIPIEAGVAIVFSIIFGIAVDDTIHIMGRFRLLQLEGKSVDESLRITLLETGKAVCLTTFVLFAGFLILLFSSNPPANTIGILIGFTLLSALVYDLFLLPVLLRIFVKERKE